MASDEEGGLMTREAPIQSAIITMAKRRGAYARNIPGTEFASGIPDVLICYKGLWVAIEVKGPDGSLRPGQRLNIKLIQKAKGIAEAVRTVKEVEDIFDEIDNGIPHRNGRYW